MSKFYTYTLAYPESMGGAVFYVGKGTGDRILAHEREAKHGKKSHKCNIIRKIWHENEQVVRQKVGFFEDEAEAFEHEKALIASLGKETLSNLCDGGEGGRRPGSGRKSLGGGPVFIDMPIDMIDALNARAKERGITRAELIREAVRKGLPK